MTTRAPPSLCARASPRRASMQSIAACASSTRRRDDDALARGQAVGLDDDRRARGVDVGVRRGGVGEGLVAGGRDAVALHEVLGEGLRALELRRGLGRAEDAQAAGAEDVDHAGRERRLGADDGQRDLLGEREVGERVEIGDGDVAAAAARPPCRRCRAPRRRAARASRCASFQASACSRPPPPMTRTFMVGISVLGVVIDVLHVVEVLDHVEQLLHARGVVARERRRCSRAASSPRRRRA